MALARSVASHYAAASKGRLIRCTVLGSTPNRAAILRTLSPVSLRAFSAAEMRASMSAAMRAACPLPWPAEAQRAPVPG
jgi:hypothetical protein